MHMHIQYMFEYRHSRVLEALSVVSEFRQMERFECIISCIWSQLMSASSATPTSSVAQQQSGPRTSTQAFDSGAGSGTGSGAGTGPTANSSSSSRNALLQATMQLVNSLISAPSELNFRVHLRNEFMRAGLADVWPVCT